MTTALFVRDHLIKSKRALELLVYDIEANFEDSVCCAADDIVNCLRRKGKVLTCGCGGSAADAQHFAAELVGRYKSPGRQPLPAICLASDPVLLTALANDFGFENIFSRQVTGLARPGDVLIALSTSGRSGSVIAALESARFLSVTTVGITGEYYNDRFGGFCDHLIVIPSTETPIIQQITMVVLHAICEVIDQSFRTEVLT